MSLIFHSEEPVEILYEGTGSKQKLIPYVGLITEPLHQLGIGLARVDNAEGPFYAAIDKVNPVQCYRAFEIIKNLKQANNTNLFGAYEAAESIRSFKAGYVDLHSLRSIAIDDIESLFTSKLPNMDNTIQKLVELDLDFEVEPIIREVEAGRLELTQTVNEAIRHYVGLDLVLRGLRESFADTYNFIRNESGADRTVDSLVNDYNVTLGAVGFMMLATIDLLHNELETMMYDLEEQGCDNQNYMYDKLWMVAKENIAQTTDSYLRFKMALVQDMDPRVQFVSFHDSMSNYVMGLISLRTNFSELRNLTGDPNYEDAEVTAEAIARTINEGLYDHAQGYYNLLSPI